jgi:hypothetical protein
MDETGVPFCAQAQDFVLKGISPKGLHSIFQAALPIPLASARMVASFNFKEPITSL